LQEDSLTASCKEKIVTDEEAETLLNTKEGRRKAIEFIKTQRKILYVNNEPMLATRELTKKADQLDAAMEKLRKLNLGEEV
jgi:hypothetical protein